MAARAERGAALLLLNGVCLESVLGSCFNGPRCMCLASDAHVTRSCEQKQKQTARSEQTQFLPGLSPRQAVASTTQRLEIPFTSLQRSQPPAVRPPMPRRTLPQAARPAATGPSHHAPRARAAWPPTRTAAPHTPARVVPRASPRAARTRLQVRHKMLHVAIHAPRRSASRARPLLIHQRA